MALHASVGKNVNVEENVANDNSVDEVKNMKDFTRKCHLDDLELIVEEKSLHVSKTVLAVVSPVFQHMVQCEFRESHARSLKLPGKSFQSFHTFIKCIYPCRLDEVTEENVFAILPLAVEYQVTDLKTKCCKRLLERLQRKLQVKHLFQILEAASLYGIEQVVDKCCASIVEGNMDYKAMERIEQGFSIEPMTKVILRNKLILNLEKRLQHSKEQGANTTKSEKPEVDTFLREEMFRTRARSRERYPHGRETW